MTYDKLMQAYAAENGGPPSNGDAFNQWVTAKTGTGNWDEIPDNFFNVSASQAAATGQLPTPGAGLSGLVQAPTPTVPGGNYQQTQNATQGGQFVTSGTTDQSQTGSTRQDTSGVSTTAPVDTLGFGDALKSQISGAGASDAARTAWLTDLMQNGGTGFNSQIDQAVRNSVTGPQMAGAGDSAQARARGAAASAVGRTNLDARLGAAHELAAPTGLAALSSAANPYIGTENKTTGTTTGLSDLVSKVAENQAGTTAAQSSQAGAGQIPQGQPVKTGGCVLCTAAIELRLSNHHRVLRRVIRYKLQTDPKRFASAARGYFAVFTPFAAWLLSHPKLARFLWPLAKSVVYEELRVSGRRLPLRALPWAIHWIGHSFCATVGATLPVKDYVDDIRILDIARRNNILFEVQS